MEHLWKKKVIVVVVIYFQIAQLSYCIKQSIHNHDNMRIICISS